MAGIPFDEIEAQQGLVKVITKMVGDKLGKMVLPDGTVTDTPAVFIEPLGELPEPTLPFIGINYLQDNDNEGFLLDSGTALVEDPDNPPAMIDVPYFDTALYYMNFLVCEGDGSQSILREIKRKFLKEDYRSMLKEEANSGISLVNVIGRSPQMQSTQFREQSTMTLRLNTVDRFLDYEGGVFDEMHTHGEFYEDVDESDSPIIIRSHVLNVEGWYEMFDLNLIIKQYVIINIDKLTCNKEE